MKITELRCPKCNGTLKIDEANPNMAECEYCKSRYALEREGNDARLGAEPPKMYYTPMTPKPKPKKTGWEAYGWKRSVALVILFFVIVGVFWGPGVVRKQREMAGLRDASKPLPETELTKIGLAETDAAAEAAAEQPAEFGGILSDAVERIFGQPANALTEEQLSGISWLEMKYSGDYVMIGYSMENPYENANASLTWLEFDRSGADLNFDALGRLSGLKRIRMSRYVNAGDLAGLHLRGLFCYANSFEDLAAQMEYPEELWEVGIGAGLESLEGLDQFPSLERLELSGAKITDIKELVNLKNVKRLSINMDGVTDFSVLAVMPWLEELSIESEHLKDIGFVASMPALRSLSLIHTSLMNLSGLEARGDTLTDLCIDRSYELKDCRSVSSLLNLKDLTIDIPYGCKQPDLSGLTDLESLAISGFDSVAFLGNLTKLRSLNVTAAQIDRTDVFANLVNLVDLKCSTGPASTRKLDFIEKLPALARLDLTGACVYYDISGIFNMPTIETLKLDGMECEINFGKLRDNGSLKSLSMDGVKLFRNAQISGGNGIYSINYDDVTLEEHMDFLAHYPNLEYLSAGENSLTKVDFAAGLMKLQTLDIHENYVTDLKPLTTAASLRQVICTGNPVSNDRVLPERVILIK